MDEFDLDETDNPYSSPQADIDESAPPSSEETSYGSPRQLKVIAIMLLALASLQLLIIIVISIPKNLSELACLDHSNSEIVFLGIITILSYVIYTLAMTIVIAGCFSMLQLKSYRVAMAGGIVALIPCCSPFIIVGIPLGIWALVLLTQPHIKAEFKD